MASSSRLGPKEKGKVSVSVDVRGKMGNISKTIQVYTNDPAKPVINLLVSMHVKDRLHLSKFKAGEIFSERCRRCHIEQGRGKKGFELFRADCIMCHNNGKSASPIQEMRKKPREDIISAIRNGIDNTSMPGWGSQNGGHLKDDEIDSLVNVIKGAGF